MATKKLTVEQVLNSIGQRILSLSNLYAVGQFKLMRPTRKSPEAPISTNGPTEATQADWRSKDGTRHPGKKSTEGAGYTKMLCGLRAATEGVTSQQRLDTLADVLFTRMLPSGVGMSAAYAIAAMPTDLLATLVKERFGDQTPHVLAYIKASIRLATKCTELTKEVNARSKAGPVAL